MDSSITDPKNVWKLIYASFVACEYAPRIEYDDYGEYLGEWGTGYIVPELQGIGREELSFNKINYSGALWSFVRAYEKGDISLPFTYEQYLKNEEIIETVEAYGLDVEKFWFAIVFIYWLTEANCINVIKLTETQGEQMQKLKDYLNMANGFTISVEGKINLKISDASVISGICGYLDWMLSKNPDGLNDSYSFKLFGQYHDLLPATTQMWFVAERFMGLFKSLNLPNKRAKKNNQTVSYNKTLLISRILHLMRLTKNMAFLDSDNSLKGILSECKDLKLHIVSKKYSP